MILLAAASIPVSQKQQKAEEHEGWSAGGERKEMGYVSMGIFPPS